MAEHCFGPSIFAADAKVALENAAELPHPIQTTVFPPRNHKVPKNPQNVLRSLPTNPGERKTMPVVTGVIDYFPLALAAVSQVSKAGNDQHNPGQPLHWNRSKSQDHSDCIVRHLIERGTIDPIDGMRHSAKLAWRALALLQEELEREAGFDPNGVK